MFTVDLMAAVSVLHCNDHCAKQVDAEEAHPPLSAGDPLMKFLRSSQPGLMCMIMVVSTLLGLMRVRILPGTSMTGRSTLLFPGSVHTSSILHMARSNTPADPCACTPAGSCSLSHYMLNSRRSQNHRFLGNIAVAMDVPRMNDLIAYRDVTSPGELLHQLPILLQEVDVPLHLLAVPARAPTSSLALVCSLSARGFMSFLA